jgi:hypothetical protein
VGSPNAWRRNRLDQARRARSIALTLCVASLVFVSAALAATGAATHARAAGPCNRSAAKNLIHRYPHLDPWMPIFDRPGAVLCGSFLGPGSNSMVVSFAAATCGGSSGWPAFRRSHGEWNLAWHYRNGQASLVAVGEELKEP